MAALYHAGGEHVRRENVFEKVLESAIALGPTGEPIEIATVAVFLASDAASYMTGFTVVVDGDFLWQSPFR